MKSNAIFAIIATCIPAGWQLLKFKTTYGQAGTTDVVVMCKETGGNHSSPTPYVVWGLSFHADGTIPGCWNGKYRETLADAEEAFKTAR